MAKSLGIAALFASTVSANAGLLSALDIQQLLGSLGPAPEGDSRFTNYVAPGPGDVRSPCPGLNSLANHGFIHHDGKNLTLPHLLQGLAAGMNIGADFTIAIGGVGLLSSPYPLLGAFDLNDLDQHNFPIEHDASLSRKDAYFGNDYSFYDPFFQDVLSFYENSAAPNQTSLLGAAEAIANRTADSNSTNPTFTYGALQYVLRYGETSLYLQTMGGSDAEGVARVDWIKQLFEEERLPYNLGWRPRAEPITLVSLGQMIVELTAVSPEAVPEALQVVTGSYKDVFEAIAGGSEILGNLTQGLSSAVGL